MTDEDNNQGNTAPANKRKRNAIIIGIFAIVVIIQGIKIYNDYQTQDEQEKVISATQDELTSTITRLHEIKADLDKSIAETERLGGDIAELEKAKAEIEMELNNTRKRTGQNIQRLQEKVLGYEQLLKIKDKELEKLKTVNKELHSQNTTLKATQNELSNSISELTKNAEQLASKVAIASRLKAENIAVFAVNKRGKERKSPFRNAQIAKLKIAFNIADNQVAPIGSRKVVVRIFDPGNQIIFDVASGSGTFTLEEREEFYTAAQEILFDNTRQKMDFFYQKESGYERGMYRVEVFTDDYPMGSATFSVK